MIRVATIERHMAGDYGRWKLRSFSHMEGKRAYFYNAVCECGTETTVRISNLQQGISKSCGCLGKEARLAANLGNTTRRLGYGESAKNHLFAKYKVRAAKIGVAFALSKDHFHELCSQDCFYCGAKPASINRFSLGYGEYIYNGVDRVDNAIGYTSDNVVPCCGECNTKKGAVSREIISKAHAFLLEKERVQPAGD